MRYPLIMKALILISFLSVFTVLQVHAQYSAAPAPEFPVYNNVESDSLTHNFDSVSGSWNHLTINSDSRINNLLEIAYEENSRTNGVSGYRVQIYKGGKKEADKIRTNFLRAYPDLDVYLIFQTPDFRVRVGDFRTRSEAIKIEHQIEKKFPNPIIVDDIINFPKLTPEMR